MLPDDSVFRLVSRLRPGIVPTSAEKITKGVYSVGWRVCANDGVYFVKVNDDPRATDDFLAAQRATGVALDHGLPVPVMYGSGVDDHGRAYLVQEWLDGMDAEDYLRGRSAARRAQVLHRLATVLARMHDIACAEVGDIRAITRTKLDGYATRVARVGVVAPEDLAALTSRLSELIDRVVPVACPSLIHRDLHLPNVVVGADGDVSLVDLDFAAPGDPAEDFVKLDWWVFDNPTERSRFRTVYTRARTAGADRDLEQALQINKVMIALSYVALVGERDPAELPEWTDRLRAERRAAAALLGEDVG